MSHFFGKIVMNDDNDIVLSVRNVSKCFEIYEKPVHRLYQTLCAGRKKFYREFWALKDISFDVRKGECVGIIGRNGAGKSTLLQIITGTLAPTGGEVNLKGRVAALLELGSGFNPEFTGRENVYMNGAILGLSRREIDERFDDIVAFADIGDFIDQPVKTYSSGMMVSLAFAVNVFVDPEVLIVDEALAVGDAAFQRKCFMRMDALRQKGVTLILVTHDTSTVKERCDRAIYLKDHVVKRNGPAEDVVAEDMRDMFPSESEDGRSADDSDMPSKKPGVVESNAYVLEKVFQSGDVHSWGAGGGAIRAVRIRGLDGGTLLRTPCRLTIEVDAAWSRDFVARKISEENLKPNMMIGIRLSDVRDIAIYGTNNTLEKVVIDPFSSESATVVYDLDLPPIMKGPVFVTTAVAIGTMEYHVNLNWNDMTIELQSDTNEPIGGIFRCPTRLEVRT